MAHRRPPLPDETTPVQGGRGRIFSSLKHPNYRLLLGGQVTTNVAFWMEQVTRGWLVYEMTDSPLALGAVQAARAVPLLVFGLLGGVMADRFDRKRQMVLSQNANFLLSLILAVLVHTGHVQVWQVFATAILAGAVNAFQQPARQSLIPELVGRGELMNAIALNSGALNTTRTIGPAVAGALIATVGVAGAYYVQAALFLLATVWTIQIRLPEARERERQRYEGSLLQGVGEGLSYVRTNKVVLTLLALALVPIVLAQPYSSMIPVFARDVFQVGAVGQGVLLAVPGAGAVLGALLIAGVSGTKRKTAYLIGGVLVMGVALVAFAFSPGMAAALAALLLVGGASTSYRAVNQTLLQTNTEDAYRGRVMSIYLLDRGLAPLGSMLVGTLAHFLGARDAVAIMGVLTAIFAVVVALRMPGLRDMD